MHGFWGCLIPDPASADQELCVDGSRFQIVFQVLGWTGPLGLDPQVGEPTGGSWRVNSDGATQGSGRS